MSPRCILLPLLSNFLYPYSFSDGQSTQTEVVVSHSPLSIRFYIDLNPGNSPEPISSIYVVLNEDRKTCRRWCILSTRSAPKRGYFVNALLYLRSNRSMWCNHVAMDWHSGIYYPRYPPTSFTKFFMLWRRYWDVVTIWNLWYKKSPTSSVDMRSLPITIRTWTLIARCWEFAGPAGEGGGG